MAFGFPASYETQLDMVGNRQVVRDAIVYAFQTLGWSYTAKDPDHFCSYLPMSGVSWGETFTVSLHEGVTVTRSECRFPLQVLDWGKNKQNVTHFLAHFAPKEVRESVLPSHESLYIDECGITPLERALYEHNNEPPT